MKVQKIVANATAKVAKAMAVKACGAASMWGSYQPKEPKALKHLKK
ncbi:MAG: cyclic lactone autoinducer peptide [Ruminococcus callidus]|nr:cyclic lactone autoinducer peptide [Ruminococcus callidus]